jgi:hypothetical protein
MEAELAFLDKTLVRLLEWIRAADAKIPPILAICTSMLAVVAALFPKASSWTVPSVIVGTFSIVPLCTCLVFLFLAAFPRTQGPKGSLCYFEGIKTYDSENYLKAVRQMTKEQYSADMATQCIRNAEIASNKYWHLKIAMGSLFFSIIPWIVFVLILYKDR